MLNYRSADTLFRRASGTVACVSVLALTAIVLFLLAQGLPIFKDVPIGTSSSRPTGTRRTNRRSSVSAP